MASCMMELRGIQAALWHDSEGGNRKIDPETFWKTHYKGSKPGPFVLMTDSGAVAGSESGSPGSGAAADGQGESPFVVVGRYAHWAPGQYVYIEGDQPPRLVTGPEEDPGYGEQIDWDAGRQWGEGGAVAAGSTDVAWSGSRVDRQLLRVGVRWRRRRRRRRADDRRVERRRRRHRIVDRHRQRHDKPNRRLIAPPPVFDT